MHKDEDKDKDENKDEVEYSERGGNRIVYVEYIGGYT